MKKMNQKGFTLAELLIVVAIIAVLVAIAIPTFSDQIERSREAVDISNLRSAYSQALTKIMTIPTKVYPVVVEFKQQADGWSSDTSDLPFTLPDNFKPTAEDGAQILFFTKENADDDKIEVSENEPEGDLAPKTYTLDEDSEFSLEELTVETKIETAIPGTFSEFSNANGDVGTPTSVAAIDFGTIKGLEYQSTATGFTISGTPQNKVDSASVKIYMLDKNGVLGVCTVTGKVEAKS